MYMPHMTIAMSEETSNRLRKVVKEMYGSRKGALSNLIEEAVKEFLDRFDRPKAFESFKALKDDKVVAEAGGLEELASKLKNLGIEPRNLKIISSKRLSPIARAGFRAKAL